MGHKSRNVQVIASNNGGKLFLVSDSGIISAESEHVNTGDVVNEHSHVTQSEPSVHELESVRSALRNASSEISRLENELLARDH